MNFFELKIAAIFYGRIQSGFFQSMTKGVGADSELFRKLFYWHLLLNNHSECVLLKVIVVTDAPVLISFHFLEKGSSSNFYEFAEITSRDLRKQAARPVVPRQKFFSDK